MSIDVNVNVIPGVLLKHESELVTNGETNHRTDLEILTCSEGKSAFIYARENALKALRAIRKGTVFLVMQSASVTKQLIMLREVQFQI